jgi:hypothetical protein
MFSMVADERDREEGNMNITLNVTVVPDFVGPFNHKSYKFLLSN